MSIMIITYGARFISREKVDISQDCSRPDEWCLLFDGGYTEENRIVIVVLDV